MQHIPDKIEWASCERCGQPKRPHRICKKNMEFCAMRDDEYAEYAKKKAAAAAAAAAEGESY